MRIRRVATALMAFGALTLGGAALAQPAQAAAAEWCSFDDPYYVCLFGDGGEYAAAATGPVGTTVILVAGNGAWIDWDTREWYESQASTGYHPGGVWACVAGGPCVSYLD